MTTHARLDALPGGLLLPAGHATQPLPLLCPVPSRKVLPGQGVQLPPDHPAKLMKLPAGQGEHDAVAEYGAKLPGKHAVQLLFDTDRSWVLPVPAKRHNHKINERLKGD